MPALATGRLASREPGGLVLAIAVDGRIRATTRSYRQAGTTRFAAMLPERALPAGAHNVEVFVVGGGDALRPVAGSAAG